MLRLTLAVVAGQSAGALMLDLLLPAGGRAVSVATLLGVVLTFGAVVVSEQGRTA